MAVDVVRFVSNAFTSAFDVFLSILDATGLTPFYMAMIAILAVVVYLLTPILVPFGSSDTAKKSGKNNKSDE